MLPAPTAATPVAARPRPRAARAAMARAATPPPRLARAETAAAARAATAAASRSAMSVTAGSSVPAVVVLAASVLRVPGEPVALLGAAQAVMGVAVPAALPRLPAALL